MTEWSAFFPELLPEVPGCSDPAAERALRNAAIEFCERALVWIVDHEPVPVIAGQAAYEFEPDSGMVVVSIKQGSLNKTPITPKSAEELAAIYTNWQTETGAPSYVTQTTPLAYRLVPIPIAGDAAGLVLSVNVKPSRDATGVDDYVYQEWLDEIVCGAKARLMMQPGQRFTDQKLGDYYGRAFEQYIANASIRAGKGFTRNNAETAIRSSYR